MPALRSGTEKLNQFAEWDIELPAHSTVSWKFLDRVRLNSDGLNCNSN
jgi:hypothetical protein